MDGGDIGGCCDGVAMSAEEDRVDTLRHTMVVTPLEKALQWFSAQSSGHKFQGIRRNAEPFSVRPQRDLLSAPH